MNQRWVVVVAAVLMLALVGGPVTAQMGMFANPMLGQKAADFVLPTTAGKTQSLAQARGDSPAVIFFWATWCPHCRTQIQILNAQRGEIEAKGIRLILVDVGESPAQIQGYLSRNGIDLEVFFDEEGTTANRYALRGFPTYYFINGEGVITGVRNDFPADYLRYFSS